MNPTILLLDEPTNHLGKSCKIESEWKLNCKKCFLMQRNVLFAW
uniref:Uncharacterized protein n=1 Tax=Arundo donax TaxID=35708 RepID=A0A0A9H413_ARUDO